MKIAISTDGHHVSEHFGRCPSFTIVDIDDGKEISRQVISNPGHHPGFLPKFLREKGVHCIIAGGMGQRAMGLFAEQGIDTILGVSGSVDGIIGQLLKGTLSGGESSCTPGAGRGYGLDKTQCEHPEEKNGHNE